MLPQSLGVIGGKPNSAHYFIGYVGTLGLTRHVLPCRVVLPLMLSVGPAPCQGRSSSTWTLTPPSLPWSRVKTGGSPTTRTTVSTRPAACTSVSWTLPSQRYVQLLQHHCDPGQGHHQGCCTTTIVTNLAISPTMHCTHAEPSVEMGRPLVYVNV